MMTDQVQMLRKKWPKELKRFTDQALADEFCYFKRSDYYTSDCDRFLEWVFMTDG